MTKENLAQRIEEVGADEQLGRNTSEKVERTLTDELIVGVCFPIGSSKDEVIQVLKDILSEDYKYDVRIIKLSDFILKNRVKPQPETAGLSPGYSALVDKIENGNELRRRFNNAILAEYAIQDIHLERMTGQDGNIIDIKDLKSRRVCYIIDSLKNQDELSLFRKVYKDIFYMFSVFSPKHVRRQNLSTLKKLNPDEIDQIIKMDEYENSDYGQNVRSTFIDADFFIRIPDSKTTILKNKVNRYLNLIFGSAIVTPLLHEIAMYEAKSAAGNSACMSRQVGASITNKSGEVIARGWNDVPKYGGNLITEGMKPDYRCFSHGGICRNDKKKDVLSEDIVESIIDEEIIFSLLKAMEIEMQKTEIKARLKNREKFKSFIQLSQNKIRTTSKIKDLIEFSRSVHAELHAIIIGSQLSGNQMIGGKLFCTTFPCHNCGRHIILSGIEEIYYIEPYVKSLCLELHDDSMTDDESGEDHTLNKVKILMYDGVAPRRYLEFFTMKDARKKDGNYNLIDLKAAKPKNRMSLQALPSLEEQALHTLEQLGLLDV